MQDVAHSHLNTCAAAAVSTAALALLQILLLPPHFPCPGPAPPPYPQRVLEICADVASGLWYLHPSIVHRDLKPQVGSSITGTAAKSGERRS